MMINSRRVKSVKTRPTSTVPLSERIRRRVELGRKRRENILKIKRGMHATKSELQLIIDYSNSSRINHYLAIGHGVHVKNPPTFIVPSNMYIAFMTPPGYWGNIKDVVRDPNFSRVFGTKSTFIRMLKGQLLPREVPSIMKRGWNWKNHVYKPNTFAPNHYLEMFDKGTRPIETLYDGLSGTYEIPNLSRRNNHGDSLQLTELSRLVSQRAGSKMCILFVFGCRGDPDIPFETMQSIFRVMKNESFNKYNYPRTANVNAMRRAENATRENMRKRLLINKNILNANIRSGENLMKLFEKYPQQNIRNYILTKRRR